MTRTGKYYHRWPACLSSLFLGLLATFLCLWTLNPSRVIHAIGSLPASPTSSVGLNLVAAWYSNDHGSTQSLAWGDVDGDGDLDLAAGNSGSNKLYLNEGGMLQSTATWVSDDADFTHSVAWGDVDGDGDLDLAVGNWGNNKLYLNEGGVLQSTAAWASDDGDLTNSVAWGDVDGDGDLDLAVGNWGSNKLYLNDGGVLQSTATWVSDDADSTRSVAWGDVDGDGDLDLAAGNSRDFDSGCNCFIGDPNKVYLNEQGMLQTTAAWIAGDSNNDHTYSVAWGDADGDGDLDLAAGNDGGNNKVYLNDGAVLQSTAAWVSGDNSSNHTYSVAWGDMDGDGDLDLAAGNTFESPNKVYLNVGEVLQSAADWISDDNDYTFGLAWGDVDGDGDLDLAAGSILYLNADGMLQRTTAWVPDNGTSSSVAWGDVDGDGDLDLAAGIQVGSNKLYLNNGGMLQSIAAWTSDDSDPTPDVAWGDMDGDGDLDLAAGNWGSNKVYLNEAGVLHSTATWVSSDIDRTESVAWGDVDGDGDLDLAAGNWDGPNKVYLNEGGMLQSTAAWASGDSNRTYSVAWGDVDGDGDLDLATGNAGLNKLYLNEGGMLQSTAAWASDDHDSTRSVAWGDVDGDGDLDLVAGNWGSNKVYLNDEGVLQSTAAWVSGDGDLTNSVAWGDMDGDGDLDLAAGNDGNNKLYLNQAGGTTRFQALLSRPGPTQDADYYSTSEILNNSTIPLTYTLFDSMGSVMGQIEAFYSMDGGDHWQLAAATSDTIKTNLAAGYNYLDSSAPGGPGFNWIEIRGSGTAVSLGDDTYAGPFDLGFNLPFYDKRFDQFWIHSNGGLTFNDPGRALTFTNDCLPNSTTSAYLVAPFWDDLNPSIGGQIYYQQVDATTMVVEFHQIPHFGGGGPYTFEVILRGDGSITFQYLDMVSRLDEATIGMQNYGGVGAVQVACNTPYVQNNLTGRFRRGIQHTYTWDTFASGFFGHSDNVVLRLVAYPQPLSTGIINTYHYTNTVPGPYLWPYAASMTFPFRVRGTQVQVYTNTIAVGNEVANALVYRLLAGQTAGAEPMANNRYQPFRTDANGYLQGRGQLGIGDQLIALLPIAATESYTLYHTSATPTSTGLDSYTVTGSGVQTLTLSAANQLILFDLDVSLEWDARNDTTFLAQLERDIQRTSQILYDLTNGQVALGQVRIYHNRQNWRTADVVIQASNSQRPAAVLGGVVITPTHDFDAGGNEITNAFLPGQIRMGATWNRFGEPNGTLGEDWPRALAHELGHYLLFMPDNYLGLSAGGLLSLVDCQGSAMTNPYSEAYSEFLPRAEWQDACLDTFAARFLDRADWETITTFYPMLDGAGGNSGPANLPLAVTQVEFVTPDAPPDTLAAPIFSLIDSSSRPAPVPAGQGQAFLQQTGGNSDPTDDYLVALGAPVGDLVQARGAASGDRICVYDTSLDNLRLGCLDPVNGTAGTITLHELPGWSPHITVTPVTTQTFAITVTNVAEAALNLQLLPTLGTASDVLAMAPIENGFTQTVTLADGTVSGFVRVWVPGSQPLREMIVEFVAYREWDAQAFAWGAQAFAWGAQAFAWGAPTMSSDGQVSLFALDNPFRDNGQVTLQALPLLPSLPAWLTSVGQAYRVTAGEPLPASALLFRYLGRDVPAGHETRLRIYYSPDEGQTWQRLLTELDTHQNHASATVPGQGIFVLIATVEMPVLHPGWNSFSYPVPFQPLPGALGSIEGHYTSLYHYDPARAIPWRLHDATVPPTFTGLVNTLPALEFGHSYWIYATSVITPYLPAGQQAMLSAAESGAGALLPPATFYGWIEPAPGFTPTLGTPVTATIDGVLCGQTTVVEHDGRLAYAIQVSADDVTGQPDGCGAAGRTITFRVGGMIMGAAREWDNSQAWFHPLSPSAEMQLHYIYLSAIMIK